MNPKHPEQPLTFQGIVDRLAHLPELLRDCQEDEEAENLEVLITEIKNDPYHGK
jgi:hypothetical protein